MTPDQILDEYEWLLDGGETSASAARRVDMTIAAISQSYRRQGRARHHRHDDVKAANAGTVKWQTHSGRRKDQRHSGF